MFGDFCFVYIYSFTPNSPNTFGLGNWFWGQIHPIRDWLPKYMLDHMLVSCAEMIKDISSFKHPWTWEPSTENENRPLSLVDYFYSTPCFPGIQYIRLTVAPGWSHMWKKDEKVTSHNVTNQTNRTNQTNHNDAATQHPIKCVSLQAKKYKMMLARRVLYL